MYTDKELLLKYTSYTKEHLNQLADDGIKDLRLIFDQEIHDGLYEDGKLQKYLEL